FLDALDAAFARVEADSAQPLVITGQGRSFSAGMDLPSITGGGVAYLQSLLPALSRALRRMVLFPRPLVAAVNGHAIAGGAIIMMAADYRLLALGEGRVGLTELAVGVPFPTWPLEIARAAIPREHFARLIYTAALVSPSEAHALGLVEEVIEQEELLDRAFAVARQLAAVPAETFAITKRQLRSPLVEAAERRAPSDDNEIFTNWSSEKTQQNIRSFIERTIGQKK
ncbi:MAG TPA: enoyl-CoA hydratase-related protein, partial [Pirellulales bacterium]